MLGSPLSGVRPAAFIRFATPMPSKPRSRNSRPAASMMRSLFSAARSLGRARETAQRLGQADDDEVPEGVPTELAAAEAVLERVAPDRVAPRQRNQAPAKVARRRHAEVASETARRTSVIGHAHHTGDRSRVLPRRP